MRAPPSTSVDPTTLSPELGCPDRSIGVLVGVVPCSRRRAGAPSDTRGDQFFTAHIRNRNTRHAYLASVRRFAEWCELRGLALDQVEPVVVAAYVEELTRALSPATVKQASSEGLL